MKFKLKIMLGAQRVGDSAVAIRYAYYIRIRDYFTPAAIFESYSIVCGRSSSTKRTARRRCLRAIYRFMKDRRKKLGFYTATMMVYDDVLSVLETDKTLTGQA